MDEETQTTTDPAKEGELAGQSPEEGETTTLPTKPAPEVVELQEKITNLEKLVGDQKIAEDRKKAQLYDESQKQKKAQQEGTENLYNEIKELKFLQANPEAKEALDDIKAWANYKGISFQEAYEGKYKARLEAELTLKKQKEEELKSIPEGSQKIFTASDEFQKAKEELRRGNRKPVAELLARKLFGRE